MTLNILYCLILNKKNNIIIMKLKILKYKLLNNTVESSFLFCIKTNSKIENEFNLKVPSSPLIDIDILNLNDLPCEDGIKKIDDIIKKDYYSFKTNLALKNFLNFITSYISNQNNILI